MLVYAAIGDAYGAAFEFVEKDRWPQNDGKHFYTHPDLPLGHGKYTDDTQMMIGLADFLINVEPNNQQVMSKRDLMEYWFYQYKEDPRDGYAGGFKSLLDGSSSATELLSKMIPDSTRSGAVMRSPVLGFLNTPTLVNRWSNFQVEITHNTDIAKHCSSAVALAAHYLLHQVGPREELGQFLNANTVGATQYVDWTEDRTEWASVEAVDCARNAITAWRNSRTLTEVLTKSVAPGGDTDTVATIAMSLAWCDSTIENDFETKFLNSLEAGNYGFEFLFNKTVDLRKKYL